MAREAGILLPIASLPGPYGIGCFSKHAYAFIDWLKDSGLTYWQVLPLGPTSYGDSPYQSFSTFAGNPYFIDLEELVKEGVLTLDECNASDFGNDRWNIDYEKIYYQRYPLLRKAYERSEVSKNPDYQKFVVDNDWWLADYALFMAVKGRFDGAPWTEWAEDIRLRRDHAMDYYRRELYFEIEFQQYMQFKFFQQWSALRDYAHRKGIQIIGDIPIYVAMDSADTWSHPELFQLDENNVPTAVAGCPPDGTFTTGQLWCSPLYRWDYHKRTDYDWWISRLRYCFQLYDVIRIDHFRGFDEYYSIPYGENTVLNGHWEKGPSLEIFQTMERRLGKHRVIAEDLGYVTDTVRQLVQDSGFLSMKVLELAFDSRDFGYSNDHLPHNYIENCVVYTSTHDNETIAGWLTSITPAEQQLVRDYLCDQHTPTEELSEPLVALAMGSIARICIIPLQDYLGYDNTCRINKPSTVGKNWRWRVTAEELTKDLQANILATTKRYGRMNFN